MNRFEFCSTPITGLNTYKRKCISDERGYLERLFCSVELKKFFGNNEIKQINHTHTKKIGSVRGLHFQYPPYADKKIITCIKGSIFDIAVDLRKKSPTFLQYHAEVLSDKNFKSFFIPEGFAHGFQTMEDDCELLYFHSAEYNSDFESGININDPRLNIMLPKPILNLSERDKNLAFIDENFVGIEL
jgi:dTDP-4-dehydrorhamnose 3,5-epimerase